MDRLIHFNVGGTVFSMLESTIAVKGSYFESILSTDISCIRDKDGNIFIDRSPVYFSLILDYLRSGEIVLDVGTNRNLLLTEINYYGLTQLEEKIQSMKEVVYDRLIKLNVRGTVYHVLESGLENSGFLQCQPNWTADDEIYISKSCSQFNHIVELLHDSNYYPQDILQTDMHVLCRELRAYGLHSLSEKVHWRYHHGG